MCKAVRRVASLEEDIKWGHLVYAAEGPVLFIRAEPNRVLFGFWRSDGIGHNTNVTCRKNPSFNQMVAGKLPLEKTTHQRRKAASHNSLQHPPMDERTSGRARSSLRRSDR